MTAGRKGIPYDLSQFASVVTSTLIDDAESPIDNALEADERVLVAA